ncbi:hypothetical protein FQR65_LT08229 [Abscondita terminalis]|nr:hypothetical protein FQR65_LT08229 [Abscondita terminalis]
MERNVNQHTSTVDGSQIDEMNSPLQIVIEIFILFFKICSTMCETLFRFVFPMREKSVKGEIVLITGTGHGIGKELALQYADLDAIVVCWDINEQTNNSTVSEILTKGKLAYAYTCDVTKRNQVLETVEKVKREVGNVSILINNAGILIPRSLLHQNEGEIQRTIDVNVMSHFWTLQGVLPGMMENNHGHIVAISSFLSFFGYYNLIPYCTSKFAVHGLMSALHQELRVNSKNQIKLTTIFPHIVDTGLCTTFTVRFPTFFKEISPKIVAKAIITAQRREIVETTVPSYSLGLKNIGQLLPKKAIDAVIDFLGFTLLPDK